MTIATAAHRGFLLRAYAHKIFPTVHDPYASGAEQYTAVVRIENTAPSGGPPRRYDAEFKSGNPSTSSEALALGLQWGQLIVNGKVKPQALKDTI